MSAYIIGVDAGGTKTLGVLFNKEGKEILRSISGYGNFSVNESETKKHIIEVIQSIFDQVDHSMVSLIQIGIAGYSNYKNKASLITLIEETFKTKVLIVTDAEVALYSIKKSEEIPVIMVLGGTGSVVVYEYNHLMHMIGGFGHLLGDEGSGYHLSITALKEVINQFEERMPISSLSKSILQEIGASNYSEIKKFVYNNEKAEIARLSEFIAKHALRGDTEAIDLFVREGRLLAKQTLKAYQAMDKPKEVMIGFKGGFLLNAPYVKKTLMDALNENGIHYQMETSSVEPVIGTYYLAKKHIDKR